MYSNYCTLVFSVFLSEHKKTLFLAGNLDVLLEQLRNFHLSYFTTVSHIFRTRKGKVSSLDFFTGIPHLNFSDPHPEIKNSQFCVWRVDSRLNMCEEWIFRRRTWSLVVLGRIRDSYRSANLLYSWSLFALVIVRLKSLGLVAQCFSQPVRLDFDGEGSQGEGV